MSKNITVNGTTYDASYVNAPLADGSGNATFRESSELSLQSKSVTPTKDEQSVSSDPPYFGLSGVTVKAIPSEYVKPTSTNAGGELAAGSTIAAGTYFTGEATVPSGGSGGPQLATYIGKCTVTMGGNTASTAAGKMQIIVPKEEVERTYIFYTPDGRNRNRDMDMCLYLVRADNDANNAAVGSRAKSSAGSDTYYNNHPGKDAWIITDNGDNTLTIACVGENLQVSWWYYNEPERNWYCFRLNNTIEVAS